MSVWSPMILMEFLLAPTVPSEPSPQNMQLMVSLFSTDRPSATGMERLETSSLMPTVKSWKQAPSRWSKTALTMAGVNSLELRP